MVVSLVIGAFVLQYICAFTYAIEIGWDSPSRDVLDTVATKLKYFQKEPELFCEHESSCGHHADSGPTHSPQDPKTPGDGKECYCYGLNPVNGQRERLCYIGRCDYGKKKSEMRDKRVEDIVSDFTMSRIPKTNAQESAALEGLCKYTRLIDNIVSSKLCERHTTPKEKFDMHTRLDSPFMEPSLREYFLKAARPESASGETLSLQERIDNLMRVKRSVKVDAEEKTVDEKNQASKGIGMPMTIDTDRQ